MFRMKDSEIRKPCTFLYFAYGSNLWTFRMRMTNPSAKFMSMARLDNYRMDFIKFSRFWGGPTATIVPTANAHVWGVIWRLDINDMLSLDDQEGVDIKKYFIKYVRVLTPYMGEFTCRTYIQRINPLPRGDNAKIPVEQWPSRTYKKVIILGAIEHRLPDYYINALEKLNDNGEEGCLRLAILLRGYEKGTVCECLEPYIPPERIYRKPLKLDLIKLRKIKDTEKT